MTTFDNLINAHSESIQIWGSSEGTDDLGNTVKTWDDDKGTSTAVIQIPSSRDIELSAGRIEATDKKVFALSDADITTGYRIEIENVNYDLIGAVDDWKAKQAGTVQYLRLFLRRVL